jgi:hypothetical protein
MGFQILEAVKLLMGFQIHAWAPSTMNSTAADQLTVTSASATATDDIFKPDP